MISFIIIGRNEGWKLTKSLKSVFNTIKYNDLRHAEVIYVDSKSTDDSLAIAKSFEKVKTFEITGECNAAIARNIGAKEAKGDILFFIDGDMEVERSFLSQALTADGKLKHDCLSGHLDDYLYSVEDEFLGIKKRTYKDKIPKESQILQTNGGAFLIKKVCWDEVGGMKTKYRRSQDLDLFFQLSKIGVKIIQLPHLIVKHHTVDYRNEDRMWKDLFKGNILFDSLLFRDHIFSLAAWKRMVRSKYTSILMLLSIISLFISFKLFLLFLFSYIVILAIRVCVNTLNTATNEIKLIYGLKRWMYQLIRDVIFWFAIVLFWPTSKPEEYRRIQ